jgi:hypothetical protein
VGLCVRKLKDVGLNGFLPNAHTRRCSFKVNEGAFAGAISHQIGQCLSLYKVTKMPFLACIYEHDIYCVLFIYFDNHDIYIMLQRHINVYSNGDSPTQ